MEKIDLRAILDLNVQTGSGSDLFRITDPNPTFLEEWYCIRNLSSNTRELSYFARFEVIDNAQWKVTERHFYH